MSGFTSTDEYDLSAEWHECKNGRASEHRPRGWKTWNLRRIRHDIEAIQQARFIEKGWLSNPLDVVDGDRDANL